MEPKLTRLQEWAVALKVLRLWSDVPGLTANELMKDLQQLIKEYSDGSN
jgi:hypothetical protein